MKKKTKATKMQNDIKEMILSEYRKGNIVVLAFDGLQVAPLKEIIKQPIDGLLYDLNRNETTVLTFVNDPKWINDYAMLQVVRELKQQLEEGWKSAGLRPKFPDKEEIAEEAMKYSNENIFEAGVEWLRDYILNQYK